MGSQFPNQGSNPRPLRWSLNHSTTGEVSLEKLLMEVVRRLFINVKLHRPAFLFLLLREYLHLTLKPLALLTASKKDLSKAVRKYFLFCILKPPSRVVSLVKGISRKSRYQLVLFCLAEVTLTSKEILVG